MTVFPRAFLYVDSRGLPLPDVMRKCSEAGCPADLTQFVRDAIDAGWPLDKALAVVREALIDLRGEHVNFCIEDAPASKA